MFPPSGRGGYVISHLPVVVPSPAGNFRATTTGGTLPGAYMGGGIYMGLKIAMGRVQTRIDFSVRETIR